MLKHRASKEPHILNLGVNAVRKLTILTGKGGRDVSFNFVLNQSYRHDFIKIASS
jgi:hypothetical protein